jgi:hypothetical protein
MLSNNLHADNFSLQSLIKLLPLLLYVDFFLGTMLMSMSIAFDISLSVLCIPLCQMPLISLSCYYTNVDVNCP